MQKKMMNVLRSTPENFGRMLDKLEKFAGEAVFEYDRETAHIWVFGKASELFAGDKATIYDFRRDERVLSIIEEADLVRVMELYSNTTPELSRVNHVCRMRLGDGEEQRWYRIMLDVFFDDRGNRVGFFGELADVNVAYGHFMRLRYDAHHDSLTGLYRHHYAKEKVLARLADPDEQALILFLDIDNFKAINDDHGHFFGDRVLKMLADHLMVLLSDGCLISRWGGDEFMAYVPYKKSPDEMAGKIKSMLRFTVDGVAISLSAGAADTAAVGRDYEKLCLCADRALFSAKRQGKSRCNVYDPTAEQGEKSGV